MLRSNILYNDANLTEMHNFLYTVALLYTAVVIYFLLPLCGLSSVNRTIFTSNQCLISIYIFIWKVTVGKYSQSVIIAK